MTTETLNKCYDSLKFKQKQRSTKDECTKGRMKQRSLIKIKENDPQR